MPSAPASPLAPGLATGIGSLPYVDADRAARVSLQLNPRLPAAPQLPARTPMEGLVAQWAGALPEISVGPDGTIALDRDIEPGPPQVELGLEHHAGILAFLEAFAARSGPGPRLKIQLTGPLTLGVALERAGLPPERAFRRAAELVRAWAVEVGAAISRRLPGAAVLLVLDEPALVLWRKADGPIDREVAVDLLSGALASAGCATGVHVCGDGDRRLALEAGPQVLAVEVRPELESDGAALARHLDSDGWIAWGAVPTDRPVGESPEPLWRELVSVWCELTRRGCDPRRLRTQAILTPACGLAGHGATQAEHVLRLTVALANRVHDQAIAARLTLGA